MGLSCLLGISHFVSTKVKFSGVIFWPNLLINPLLSKLVWSHGLISAKLFFCVFVDIDEYPATLTSCLVNNAYIRS